MNNTIQITIGMPVYGVEKYIRKSILSVLNQSIDCDMEVLVIDDCGTDHSMDIIKECQASHPKGNMIRIIRQPKNMGCWAARNTILDEAKGKYIFLIDADDYLSPNALEKLYNAAEEHQAEAVYGSVVSVDEAGEPVVFSIGDMKTTLNEAISEIGGGSTSYSSGGGGGGSSVKYFLNQTVSSWVSDSTYPLYPYKGFISIEGVSSADGGEVSYSTADADSGNFSPICQTTTDGVWIWAKTQPQSLTIPTVAIAVNSDIDLQGEAPYLSTEHGGTVNGDVTVTGNVTATNITELERNEIIAVPVSGDVNDIASGTGNSVNLSTSAIPSGYTMIGLTVWQTNGWNLISVNAEILGTTPRVRVWNGRTSAVSVHVNGLLFCKRT